MTTAATGTYAMRSSAGQGLALEADLSRVDAARLNALWPRGGMIDSPPWRADELGQVLRHQLAASFAGGAAVPGEPSGTAGHLLFCDAEPPSLERLRQLKEWAKPNMSREDGDVPREVAGVIYFAAIVCALVRGGARISRLGDERLRAGVRWALGLPWLDGETTALFRRGWPRWGQTAERGRRGRTRRTAGGQRSCVPRFPPTRLRRCRRPASRAAARSRRPWAPPPGRWTATARRRSAGTRSPAGWVTAAWGSSGAQRSGRRAVPSP